MFQQISFGAALLGVVLCASPTLQTQSSHVRPVTPPTAPVRPVTDGYYGTKIVDNYRYMEDLRDPEVQGWFKDQDAYARAALASIPGRAPLLARIQALDKSAPVFVSGVRRLPGDLYFYQKWLAGADTPKLHMRQG